MEKNTGQCLCGSIQFTLTGTPLIQGNCHCNDCRKATGASFATIVFFKEEDFSIDKGKPVQFEHTVDSGNILTKEFCPNCGSLLFGKNSSRPRVKSIFVGCLDDASFVKPEFNVWTSRALPFTQLDEKVTCFDKQRG